MSLVVWFDRCGPGDRARIGAKNANLAEMIAAGLPVPPGFALTTDAYDTLRRCAGARRRVNEALSGVDHDDPVSLRRISAEVRGVMESVPLDPQVAEQVTEAYSELSERCGRRDVPVAVRSSATAEDLPDASFAGQQDTFLWVRGAEDVLAAVRRCWSSVFTARAISYRHHTGHSHEAIAMSVGIQQMVEARAAGVAFTLNPTDGDRSQIVIDASWGFGEAVVAGEVTPDNFAVDKVLFEIMGRTISPKTVEYALTAEGTVARRTVGEERANRPCLADGEVKEVARMARRVEKHYGTPQDIEWAVDGRAPVPGAVVLLQARPETVWSRKKPRKRADHDADPMAAMVARLIRPVHTTGGKR